MENKMETTIMVLGFKIWGLGLRVQGLRFWAFRA